MTTWPEIVSNEGHINAAFSDDLASSSVEEPFEDGPRGPFPASAEELPIEEDRRWLEEAARNGWQAATLELAELLDIKKNGSPHMEFPRMLTTDFTPHLERLLVLRARLRDDITQMADNALNQDRSRTTSMPNHMAELGSGNFDQELTLSLLGSESNSLDQIEAAIGRIADGSFGRCETCGVQIPEARLEALPYAAQCVSCASEEENSLTTLDRRGGSQHRVLPR
jgi:RNA polymerase-binding transcription factor DksA